MYKIRFIEKAEKLLRKLDNQMQRKIISYLDQPELLRNPKSLGKPLLHNKKGSWRYRVGSYRIICQIVEKELVVLVLELGHRKEIYK